MSRSIRAVSWWAERHADDLWAYAIHRHSIEKLDRKIRLFLVALGRRVAAHEVDEFRRGTLVNLLNVCEQYADRMNTWREVTRALSMSISAYQSTDNAILWDESPDDTVLRDGCVAAARLRNEKPCWINVVQSAVQRAAHASSLGAPRPQYVQKPILRSMEHHILATMTRCCVADPNKTIILAKGWLTPAVLGLAQNAYANPGEEDTRPILADALQDAGCGDEEILSHLRTPGQHYRGCWPVDLILGKE